MGNKKNSWFVWSARLLSIFLLLLVMVVGMLAFGYAQDSAKIRVSHVDDEQFQIEADSGMIMSVIDGDAEKQTKDKIAIKSGQNILSYISEVKKSETWFWMVAGKVKMTVPEGTKVEATVRTSADNQQWSDWQDLDLAVLPDDSGVYMSEAPVLLNQKALYAQYSLVLKTDNSRISPQVDEVKLTFLDPDDKLAFVKKGWKWVVGKATGRENIKVVTRAEWGADESLMTWKEMEYAPVQQIIVHHTAGSNNSPLDPAAVVRGIYYFHAVEKDWGDIGYNYLVDQYGNIYEGREGGLGVVGAHALSNNYGSVGVALIGEYTSEAPAANSIRGLIDLVSYIGYQTGLDLTATHTFQGKNIPVVAGHRDVNYTECPGEQLYGMLSDVANAAKAGLSDLPEKTYQAKFIGLSEDKVSLETGETKSAVVQYQNSGTATWLKDKGEISLVPVDPYPRSSGFASKDWKSSQEVGFPSSGTVAAGDKVYFDLNLQGGKESGDFDEWFALKGPNGIMEGSEFEIKISNQFQESNNENINNSDTNDNQNSNDEVVNNDVVYGENDYHALWLGQSENVELFPGEKKEVWIEVKNNGEAVWKNNGANAVRLGTANPLDRASVFYDQDSWLANNRIKMTQSQVVPGEKGKFKFYIQGGLTPGVYDEYFRLVAENMTWMEDEGIFIRVTIKEPQYTAELGEQSEKVVPMLAGQRARFWVEFKNTGNVTWKKEGNTPVILGTDEKIDRESIFYTPGFWLAPNRVGTMKQSTVAPGDTARFEILMTAPSEPGVYREYFRPVVENMTWVEGAPVYWEIEVE